MKKGLLFEIPVYLCSGYPAALPENFVQISFATGLRTKLRQAGSRNGLHV
jgi:hypothetical protein